MLVFYLFSQPGLVMSEHVKQNTNNLEHMGLRLQPQDPSNLDNGCCFFAVLSRDIYFGVSTAMIAVDICLKRFSFSMLNSLKQHSQLGCSCKEHISGER